MCFLRSGQLFHGQSIHLTTLYPHHSFVLVYALDLYTNMVLTIDLVVMNLLTMVFLGYSLIM